MDLPQLHHRNERRTAMSEPTPEQHEAISALTAYAKRNSDTIIGARIGNLLSLLPDVLTNLQPVLPTEPGAYHDARGTLTIIDPRGKWHGTYGDLINPDLCPGPFTRLVPERPQVTEAEAEAAYIKHGLRGIFKLLGVTDA